MSVSAGEYRQAHSSAKFEFGGSKPPALNNREDFFGASAFLSLACRMAREHLGKDGEAAGCVWIAPAVSRAMIRWDCPSCFVSLGWGSH